MKKMKKISIWMVMVFVGLSLSLSAAYADTVNIGDTIKLYDDEGTLGGGEFGVALVGTSTELFRTFCIQRTEYMDFDSHGFNIVGITKFAEGGHDELDPKTAWLYTQYRNQTLSNFDYTPTSAEHVRDANALQAVIWHIEQEPDYGIYSALPDQSKLWFQDAINAGWTDVHDVRILNLTWATARHGFAAGAMAQDQLTLVYEPPTHVPEPGSILLLCLGLLGIGVLKKKH